MRLTPKHVGMEIQWHDSDCSNMNLPWQILLKIRICKSCDTPHDVVSGGFYDNFELRSKYWRVRKPQKKGKGRKCGS